jgi:DNA-binding response OmpR family regulator
MERARPLILVADDDPDILELVKLRLARSGFDVVAAQNGLDALELAQTRSPDLAVLDVSMPGLDGGQVVTTLRSDPATHEIPVILLTARATAADVEAGLATGADDYVTKPFSPEVLQGRVSALLRAAEVRRPQPLRLAGGLGEAE